MKIKHTLISMVLGQLLVFVGGIIKINHMPQSKYLLTTGLVLIIGGGIAFLYKLSTHPKVKDFLNF